MQAYAEGFALMKSKTEFGLDMHKIATTWQHGSVVRSWLLDLAANALSDSPELSEMAAYVPDSGMGRMTVRESIDQRVPLAGDHGQPPGALPVEDRGQLCL